MEIEIMDEKKAKPRKGTVGGGRAIGQKNLVAPATKRSVSEIFRGMMGLDDEAVEATGQINREGYGFRLRWKEILDGRRTPDPAYTQVVRLSLAYGVGTPGKMEVESAKRKSLVFVSTTGLLPWDPRMDNMKEQTDRMLAQGKAEDELRALETAKPAEVIDVTKGDTDVELLEVVTPPPADDPSAFR
jgi:hypothetical protein